MLQFIGKEGEQEIEYRFPQDLLSQFAFHHLEWDRVAVRLCVPWGAEIYRFRTTSQGFCYRSPPACAPRF